MDDIWSDCIDYPDMGEFWERGFIDGTKYGFVSSTLLNALLPYLTTGIGAERGRGARRAFLLQRYHDEVLLTDGQIRAVTATLQTSMRTNLSAYGDDVVLICETPRYWWFLHLDCDTSDCEVGRLSKEECSLADIEAWVRAQHAIRADLPLNILRGWVQW